MSRMLVIGCVLLGVKVRRVGRGVSGDCVPYHRLLLVTFSESGGFKNLPEVLMNDFGI